MSKGKVLILDGDSIAYRCSASAEKRGIKVTHKPSGKEKLFKHRTEFKTLMHEKSKEITDDYFIEDTQESEPASFVMNTIKNHIKRIENEVEPIQTIIYAGEDFNFRSELPLPKKYKGQRSNTLRPLLLKDSKTFLHRKYGAETAVGMEVDDACCIAAYTALEAGYEPIMYFYEKDQYQLDGVTLLYDSEFFTYEKVPVLGNLRLEKTAVKGLGLKFLAYQWVCSDPVDNYCAYDLSSVRFGAKSAYNLLNDCQTEQEVLVKVIDQFKKFYPTPFEYTDWKGENHSADWLSMMKLYYKCCRMMRTVDDKLDCMDLFNRYGVTL